MSERPVGTEGQGLPKLQQGAWTGAVGCGKVRYEGSWRAVGLSKHGSCCPAALLGSHPQPSLQGPRPGVCGHVLLPPGYGEVSFPLCSRGQCVVAEA